MAQVQMPSIWNQMKDLRIFVLLHPSVFSHFLYYCIIDTTICWLKANQIESKHTFCMTGYTREHLLLVHLPLCLSRTGEGISILCVSNESPNVHAFLYYCLPLLITFWVGRRNYKIIKCWEKNNPSRLRAQINLSAKAKSSYTLIRVHCICSCNSSKGKDEKFSIPLLFHLPVQA